FNAALPLYANTPRLPRYLTGVTLDVSTEDYYWASRLIGALADHSYNQCVQHIDRYESAVMTKGRQLLREYDKKMLESGDYSLSAEANDKLAKMAKEQSTQTLNKVLRAASETMKNGYNRADN
ncbi:MAG: C69 family dipeptidase, partial [Clostridia bacterium]|nr:C69 family dipeptidase [Clostridia bacterium]